MSRRAADEFLLEFHRRHPGATSKAFGDGRMAHGGSSYDWLADTIPAAATSIVDLGCGDGHLLSLCRQRSVGARLFGIDFSPAELTLAEARTSQTGALLTEGNGAHLPYGDATIDHIVSHLAFMLMTPIEAVVAELARVLKPGGTFATIVGGGPKLGDAFERFVDALCASRPLGTPTIPPLGDRRTRSDAGLGELFCAATGFGELRLDDDYVELDGTEAQIWLRLETVYDIFYLDAGQRAALRARFADKVAGLADETGRIPCRMAVRRVQVTRH